MFPGELTGDELRDLTASWVKRQEFVARQIALQVGLLLAGKSQSQQPTRDEMWHQLGTLRG